MDGNVQPEQSAPPPIIPEQTETPTASPGDSSSPTDDSEPSAPTTLSGEVVITFDYEKQSGSASNQYAVWIEDMDGNHIKTLYATKWTADGGYKRRPDTIAIWVEKSELAALTKSEVDAISGATPRAGTQAYTWDLADASGNVVTPGKYQVFVEGTLRWKNYVLYSGVIELDGNSFTIEADAEFVYEASDRYAALSLDSPENAMIGAVTVSFISIVSD